MGGHSSRTALARGLKQPTRATSGNTPMCRPYSVLLPVGFAVPPPLPDARCALTAPFHPCRADTQRTRRSVLCGTFPRLAPAGRYPAPHVHGARTFLPGDLSVLAGAAVQPTDQTMNGGTRLRRQDPRRPAMSRFTLLKRLRRRAQMIGTD